VVTHDPIAERDELASDAALKRGRLLVLAIAAIAATASFYILLLAVSTVHGAGRVMSRSQAAGRVRRRKRWVCTNAGCERVFDARRAGEDVGDAHAPAVCPEHPGHPLAKVWVEEQLKPGKVDWPAVQRRLRDQGIVLIGGGADEAPEVYKRLPDVLAAHAGSVRVKHILRPLGVAMAGRVVYDPYKD
jgi:tRNA-splicing ligase RtcB (3'-phosphate/5'-hydroxy nucleic acid ligase)